jgi:hypothetical protein
MGACEWARFHGSTLHNGHYVLIGLDEWIWIEIWVSFVAWFS